MASTTTPMIDTYPAEINLDRRRLAATVDALIACSQACTACADACLSEQNVADLAKCIRGNLDCADVCSTTARVLSRHTGVRRGHQPCVAGGLCHGVQVLW